MPFTNQLGRITFVECLYLSRSDLSYNMRGDKCIWITNSTFQIWNKMKFECGYGNRTNNHFALFLLNKINMVMEEEKSGEILRIQSQNTDNVDVDVLGEEQISEQVVCCNSPLDQALESSVSVAIESDKSCATNSNKDSVKFDHKRKVKIKAVCYNTLENEALQSSVTIDSDKSHASNSKTDSVKCDRKRKVKIRKSRQKINKEDEPSNQYQSYIDSKDKIHTGNKQRIEDGLIPNCDIKKEIPDEPPSLNCVEESNQMEMEQHGPCDKIMVFVCEYVW